LEKALERYQELRGFPKLDVKIYSDSRYAVNCMNTWIYRWVQNGWKNTKGNEVCNRDLIQRASDLDDEPKDLGYVKYLWTPREQNSEADQRCNACLDKAEEGEGDVDDNGSYFYY
jgi:ribonuclease HI